MLPVSLLPTPYRETAFIAGGFAACPALAADVDVWCPVDLMADDSDPFGLVWAERDRIVDWLKAQFGSAFVEHDASSSRRGDVPTPPSFRHGQLVSTFEGYHLPIPIRRAGAVTIVGHALPYHIIVVGGDVDEVLSSFDITTHMVALTPRGVVVGEHYTPPFEEPRVITKKYTTEARMEKIRARYRWPVQA